MVYISANIHVHIGFLKLLSPDVISGVMVKNVLAGYLQLTAGLRGQGNGRDKEGRGGDEEGDGCGPGFSF